MCAQTLALVGLPGAVVESALWVQVQVLREFAGAEDAAGVRAPCAVRYFHARGFRDASTARSGERQVSRGSRAGGRSVSTDARASEFDDCAPGVRRYAASHFRVALWIPFQHFLNTLISLSNKHK